MAVPYYITKLADELSSRQRKNPSFSLRAFAKHIGLASPVLSEVFRGKRKLPLKYAAKIVEQLGYSPLQRRKFIESVAKHGTSLSHLARRKAPDSHNNILDEERHFKIIAEWEYYAVLSLMDLKSFSTKPEWIADQLGITPFRAKLVWEGLTAEGLVQKNGSGKYQKRVEELTTTQDVKSPALRQSHRESLQMAEKKLESISIDQRFYSSTTVAIDPERLPEAKELFREFRKKLSVFFKEGTPQEVYQFCFQVFPLTNNQKESDHV